jgi:quercetin dioxygenase-like cupin family protein
MNRQTTIALLTPLVLLWQAASANAQGAAPASHAAHMIVAHAAELEWKDGPGSLPPGAQSVLLEGSPAEAGPLTLRLRLPANYRIPPHFHSAIEHVTVLSGTFHMGTGERIDASQATALPVGSFTVVPVGQPHYAYAGAEPVIIQLHSTGPWDVTYLNPTDDPRKR